MRDAILPTDAPVKIAARDLNFWYDKFHAVKNIQMQVPEKRVTALIGEAFFVTFEVAAIDFLIGALLLHHEHFSA